jgi:hypothetical protein
MHPIPSRAAAGGGTPRASAPRPGKGRGRGRGKGTPGGRGQAKTPGADASAGTAKKAGAGAGAVVGVRRKNSKQAALSPNQNQMAAQPMHQSPHRAPGTVMPSSQPSPWQQADYDLAYRQTSGEQWYVPGCRPTCDSPSRAAPVSTWMCRAMQAANGVGCWR